MPGYKLIVKNAKVILKTVTNAVLNITGIKDLLTGTGSVDSNNKINWTLQEYTNTVANFTSNNPVLLLGQKGIETDDLLTAPKFKIGDGVTAWNSLPYLGGSTTTPLGLIQIIDLEGFFFTDLATAHAWLLTMFIVPPTITNESFDSGVYYFTVPPNTTVDGYFLFDGISGLPNKVSCIDPLGLLVQFNSGASFVLNSGNHILGNCSFADTDFIDFSGTVVIKNIVDIFTSIGGTFGGSSTGKFIINGSIGPLETAQFGAGFFSGSTATIFVNAAKYTSNSGAIHGDLQTAIANGCNVQFDGINLVTLKSTQTLTNKRITNRVLSITSSATPTINTDNCDSVDITALATAITSMTSGLTGTPTNFQKLIIRIKDNGTARAITWGASFASRGATLPTTTVLGKVTTIGLIYNTTTSIWGCVAVAQEV